MKKFQDMLSAEMPPQKGLGVCYLIEKINNST